MEAYTKADGLGIFLSGGANNLDESASLGGAISSKAVRGMSVIYTVHGTASSSIRARINITDNKPENGD